MADDAPDSRYTDAAEEILAAVRDGDASALSDSLQSFVSMCSSGE